MMRTGYTWDLSREQLFAELKRREKRRFADLGKLEIRKTGSKIRHGLGVVPNRFSIVPIVDNSMYPLAWCFYQRPDSEYLYIRPSDTGMFLISVGRE